MYPYTVIPSLSQQIVRFLLLNSNFSPFSVSFHYYNINISPRKYFPRISFPSRWYERLVTKHVTDGNIFSRKKGAIARAAKETKPVPLSPEWFDCVEKRKIRADFPFLVFFQPGGRSTMLFRVSQHLSSSSNRDLWDAHSSEKGAIFVTRRDIAFYVHDTFPFRCFVVLLFRRFMQSRRMVRNRRWFWNRCYSNCWNDVYESMRSYVGFILASLVYFSLRVRVYFPQSEIYLSSFLSCKIKID